MVIGGVEDEGHAQGGHVHRGVGQAAGGLVEGAGTISYRNGGPLKIIRLMNWC